MENKIEMELVQLSQVVLVRMCSLHFFLKPSVTFYALDITQNSTELMSSILGGIEMINLVLGVWKSLSSLSQLPARLPVMNRWEGTGLGASVLLISKDLIPPVLPHEHPGWVWHWSLQGPCTMERHSMGIFTACLSPCGWHPRGLADAG